MSWAKENDSFLKRKAYLTIFTRDEEGTLANVTQAISYCGADIQKADIKVDSHSTGILDFELALAGGV